MTAWTALTPTYTSPGGTRCWRERNTLETPVYTDGVRDGIVSGTGTAFQQGRSFGASLAIDDGIDDGHEEGRAAGVAAGRTAGVADYIRSLPVPDAGFQAGFVAGRARGHDDGADEGWDEGYTAGFGSAPSAKKQNGITTPPTISNVSPDANAAPGSVGAFSASFSVARVTPITFQLTGVPTGCEIAITVKFSSRDEVFTALDFNGTFVWPFDVQPDNSIGDLTVEPVDVSILPRDGWPPGSFTFEVAAVAKATT